MINRLTPLVTLKKVSHNTRVDQRVWYWTIRKLELMFANGVLFQSGEMYQAATKINKEIGEELDQALRKEFSYIKKRGAERSHYIEQWKPEFAKLLPVNQVSKNFGIGSRNMFSAGRMILNKRSRNGFKTQSDYTDRWRLFCNYAKENGVKKWKESQRNCYWLWSVSAKTVRGRSIYECIGAQELSFRG